MNSQSETGNGECLTEDLISGYLEGALTPVVKAACEVHLIACDRCRENLAILMRLLRADTDPEEEAELNRAAAQWDRRNLQPLPPVRPATVWRRVYYGFGAVAAVLLLAVLVRGFLLTGQPPGEDLIQQLLGTKRPFDAQLSNQPYLRLSTTRSPEDDRRFVAVAEKMTERSADAYRMGRLHLIAGNYGEAIQNLQEAAADPNAPPEVHNDLGVGYLQRYRTGDFERSRQELERALAQDEEFLPAIFNLSLLYERAGLTADAKQQWNRYLGLDSNSGWAQEVRQKLSRKDFEK